MPPGHPLVIRGHRGGSFLKAEKENGEEGGMFKVHSVTLMVCSWFQWQAHHLVRPTLTLPTDNPTSTDNATHSSFSPPIEATKMTIFLPGGFEDPKPPPPTDM